MVSSESDSEYEENVQLAMNMSLAEKKGMSSAGSTSNEPPKKNKKKLKHQM